MILVLGRHPVCQQTSDMLLSLLNNIYIYTTFDMFALFEYVTIYLKKQFPA